MSKRSNKAVPPAAPHDETVSTRAYDYLNKPPKAWAEYVVGPLQKSQSRIAGKDISARVFGVGNRNYGLSAPVSGGKRPAHKAGPTSGSGIDAPDSVKFRKDRDYR
jgi:hypothetical protein